jgi:hypothetical protein
MHEFFSRLKNCKVPVRTLSVPVKNTFPNLSGQDRFFIKGKNVVLDRNRVFRVFKDPDRNVLEKRS